MSFPNDLWTRPNFTGFSHIKAATRTFITRELVGIKDPPGPHETRISVFVQPFLPLFSTATTGTEHGLIFGHPFFRRHTFLDRPFLFGLPGSIIGRGGKT